MMIEKESIQNSKTLKKAIYTAHRQEERLIIEQLIEAAQLDEACTARVRQRAKALVTQVRAARQNTIGIDSFLNEYSLSSDEGLALMCLAEALLRIPDLDTRDKLIKDKLANLDWTTHEAQTNSFLMNATTWALMLTGKILSPENARSSFMKGIRTVINRSSEGLIRKAIDSAMRMLSQQFIMGRTIQEALKRSQSKEGLGYTYSYDMLGEAAITGEDAARYFTAYCQAIEAIGQRAGDSLAKNNGISIKLSALYPRYSVSQREDVFTHLVPNLLHLAQLAKQYNISLTMDAEESERLMLSLEVIEQVFSHPSLENWEGFGLAVQSYQKCAFFVLDWVYKLAEKHQRRIMIRLVKGAYWDSEIKKTQMQGLIDYPVFTRKVFTDVSFQACAKKMLTMTDFIYPQFATHNAYSVALILELAGDYDDFEFQCLHGMGEGLYQQIVPKEFEGIACRVYAPVGSHEDLLPYLVRRLLENGANTSFVNRIVDEKAPIETLIEDPVEKSMTLLSKINHNIPLPAHIFGNRLNSRGIDWASRDELAQLQDSLFSMNKVWHAKPLIFGQESSSKEQIQCYSPINPTQIVGDVIFANLADLEVALISATDACVSWSKTTVSQRASCLNRFADLLEEHRVELMAMACLEAGKTWPDALAEVREAIDFCRYYANEAERVMQPMILQGYTGEFNELSLHPRGVIVCISPWNFPLAIYVGQIVAALVTGNTVIAKPAEQTSLIACFAAELMYQAGIPRNVLQVLPGTGEVVGSALVKDLRIKGVIFTGSTDTANLIQQTLANRSGEIIPLIAETGGQNAMIVDSSALLEQVTMDVLSSAFGSAGQRCSALRVLFVQEDVFPRMKELLIGAMKLLKVGDPQWLETDVGPVIDEDARLNIQSHIDEMKKTQTCLYECAGNVATHVGHFILPVAFELQNLAVLKREVFGPVLHVISYRADALDEVIDAINQTGYGLTLGIHTRIKHTAEYIQQRVKAGNCYVNRNMIGAVVGLQPFGGEGLSGTGPKAGGPHYLLRLCHERTLTIDTTAAGGNASLMTAVDEV